MCERASRIVEAAPEADKLEEPVLPGRRRTPTSSLLRPRLPCRVPGRHGRPPTNMPPRERPPRMAIAVALTSLAPRRPRAAARGPGGRQSRRARCSPSAARAATRSRRRAPRAATPRNGSPAPTSTSAARRRTRCCTRSATAGSRARSCLRTSSSARTPRRSPSSSPSTRASRRRSARPDAGRAAATRRRPAAPTSRAGAATLDLKLIRSDPDGVKAALARRGARPTRSTSCWSSTPGGARCCPRSRSAAPRRRRSPSGIAQAKRAGEERRATRDRGVECAHGARSSPSSRSCPRSSGSIDELLADAPEPAGPDRSGRHDRGGRRARAGRRASRRSSTSSRATTSRSATALDLIDMESAARASGLALRLPEGRAGPARAGAGSVRDAQAGRHTASGP